MVMLWAIGLLTKEERKELVSEAWVGFLFFRQNYKERKLEREEFGERRDLWKYFVYSRKTK